MPRVTKADLTVSLEESLRREQFLEYDNTAWKGEVTRLKEENARLKEENASLKEDNASLKEENMGLKAERGQRARSRSPRRDAMSAAATHRVLKMAQHFERDAVVDEQRETIARQQREIESLRRGDGPIGEVLLHNWGQTPGAMSDYTVNMLMAQTTPVNTTLDALRRTTSAAYDMCLWGGVASYLVTTPMFVARMPIPE